MWQPDRAGWRARIGLISAHLDLAPESEFWTMAPAGVSVHVTRVPLSVIGPGGGITPPGVMDGIRAFAEPPLVDEAAALLASNPLDAIVYGFTSSSYLLGAEGDQALPAAHQAGHRGRAVPHRALIGGAIPCAWDVRPRLGREVLSHGGDRDSSLTRAGRAGPSRRGGPGCGSPR